MWCLASRPDAAIDVVGAGLACCSLEVEAAAQRGLIVAADDAANERRNTVLVVAGTVTKALEPAVRQMYDEHAAHGSVAVVSFGACATSGGPYWDAPTVATGLDEVLPEASVSAYVPGCPPRPEALVAELERIIEELESA